MGTWDTAPILFMAAIACPYCGAPRPIVIRSARGGDGSTSRKCVCRKCAGRFVLVVELPEIGNRDFADDRL